MDSKVVLAFLNDTNATTFVADWIAVAPSDLPETGAELVIDLVAAATTTITTTSSLEQEKTGYSAPSTSSPRQQQQQHTSTGLDLSIAIPDCCQYKILELDVEKEEFGHSGFRGTLRRFLHSLVDELEAAGSCSPALRTAMEPAVRDVSRVLKLEASSSSSSTQKPLTLVLRDISGLVSVEDEFCSNQTDDGEDSSKSTTRTTTTTQPKGVVVSRTAFQRSVEEKAELLLTAMNPEEEEEERRDEENNASVDGKPRNQQHINTNKQQEQEEEEEEEGELDPDLLAERRYARCEARREADPEAIFVEDIDPALSPASSSCDHAKKSRRVEPNFDAFVQHCKGKRVVIGGCGGGCDVFGGAVMYHAIKDIAQKVVVSNLTFTARNRLKLTTEAAVTPHMFKIPPSAIKHVQDDEDAYFPEARMAAVIGAPVYALSKETTVGQMAKGYEAMITAEFGAGNFPDIFILADGGADALMTGDETGLATPVEDMMNIKAVNDFLFCDNNNNQQQKVRRIEKYVFAFGTTVDCAHGIIPAELDARLVDMARSGTMVFYQPLSIIAPSSSSPEAATAAAVKHAQYFHKLVMKCSPTRTIVQSLVCAALEGHRGFYTPEHLRRRIGQSSISLNKQTCTYFGFDMNKVASEVKYLHLVKQDTGVNEMCDVVVAHQRAVRAEAKERWVVREAKKKKDQRNSTKTKKQ